MTRCENGKVKKETKSVEPYYKGIQTEYGYGWDSDYKDIKGT
jgi:hypothetical protein